MKILNILGMVVFLSLTTTTFYACDDEEPTVKDENTTTPDGDDNGNTNEDDDNDNDDDVSKEPSISGVFNVSDTEFSTPLTSVGLGTEVVIKGENLGEPTSITVCGMAIDLQSQIKNTSADKLTLVLPTELPEKETSELVYVTAAGEKKLTLAIEDGSTTVRGIDNEYALAGKEVEFFGTDFYYNRNLKVSLGDTELSLEKTNEKLSVTIPENAKGDQTLKLSYTGRNGEEQKYEYPYRKTPEIFLCRINGNFSDPGYQMEGVNWITYPYQTGSNEDPKPVTVNIKSESGDTSHDFYFEVVADNLPAWAYSSVATGSFKTTDFSNYNTIKSNLDDYWFKFEISIPENCPYPNPANIAETLSEAPEFQFKLGQTVDSGEKLNEYKWTGYDFDGNYHTNGKWRTISISLDQLGAFCANQYESVQFYAVVQNLKAANYNIAWKLANFRIEKKQ